MEVLPGIFNMASYVCMCKSYCFFWGGEGVSLVFPLWSQNTIQMVFFRIFGHLILVLLLVLVFLPWLLVLVFVLLAVVVASFLVFFSEFCACSQAAPLLLASSSSSSSSFSSAACSLPTSVSA